MSGGSTFGQQVVVSTGHAFGFTSAVLVDDRNGIMSWLERSPAGEARVLVRRVSTTGETGPLLQAAEGGKQGLGYPRLVQSQAGTFIVWSAPGSKLQTARLDNSSAEVSQCTYHAGPNSVDESPLLSATYD